MPIWRERRGNKQKRHCLERLLSGPCPQARGRGPAFSTYKLPALVRTGPPLRQTLKQLRNYTELMYCQPGGSECDNSCPLKPVRPTSKDTFSVWPLAISCHLTQTEAPTSLSNTVCGTQMERINFSCFYVMLICRNACQIGCKIVCGYNAFNNVVWVIWRQYINADY